MLKPVAIDLFCGAGGMSEGLIQAGFHIIFSSDINKNVAKTYINRHEQIGLIQGNNTYFELTDVRNLNAELIKKRISSLSVFKNKTLPEIDAIFGGPPCQGFSRAGKRLKNDPRNMLFKEYVRIISEVKPKYIVMENVEGFMDTKLDGFVGVSDIQYPDDTYVKDLVKSELELIGYHVLEPKILDASNYGIPQKRKRVIFIAYRNDQKPITYPNPTTPDENQKVTVEEAIGDLWIQSPTIKSLSDYQKDSKFGRTLQSKTPALLSNHEKSKHSAVIKERFSLYKEGETPKNLRLRLKTEGILLTGYPHLLDDLESKLDKKFSKKQLIYLFEKGDIEDSLLDALLTKKNSRTKLIKNGLSPTMLSSGDDFLSPFEDRSLTVREMARIQSFDDSFVFLGPRTTGGLRRRTEVPQYTQVGNAVPPLLAKAVALEVKKALDLRK